MNSSRQEIAEEKTWKSKETAFSKAFAAAFFDTAIGFGLCIGFAYKIFFSFVQFPALIYSVPHIGSFRKV